MTATSPAAGLDELARTISGHRYLYGREVELHDALEQVLIDAGHFPLREVRLRPRDRVDLLVGRIAIEVKVAGTADALARQCLRYAEHPDVDAVLVVTTRHQHRAVPLVLAGKPVRVVVLGGPA